MHSWLNWNLDRCYLLVLYFLSFFSFYILAHFFSEGFCLKTNPWGRSNGEADLRLCSMFHGCVGTWIYWCSWDLLLLLQSIKGVLQLWTLQCLQKLKPTQFWENINGKKYKLKSITFINKLGYNFWLPYF